MARRRQAQPMSWLASKQTTRHLASTVHHLLVSMRHCFVDRQRYVWVKTRHRGQWRLPGPMYLRFSSILSLLTGACQGDDFVYWNALAKDLPPFWVVFLVARVPILSGLTYDRRETPRRNATVFVGEPTFAPKPTRLRTKSVESLPEYRVPVNLFFRFSFRMYIACWL